MKALTLPQPWASLIAIGAKTIETRSWLTDYRGPLVIHAGAVEPIEGIRVGPWEIHSGDDVILPWAYDRTRDIKYPLPLGAVVASCVLADVVPMIEELPRQETWREPWKVMTVEPWPTLWTWPGYGSAHPLYVGDQLPFGDFTPGRYAWLLEDVKPTTERCPSCWGEPEHHSYDPYACPTCHCPVCAGHGSCDPVPAKGRQGLFEWTP